MDIGYTCGECTKQGHAATPTSVILSQIIPLTLQASCDNEYMSGITLKTNLCSNQVTDENCLTENVRGRAVEQKDNDSED